MKKVVFSLLLSFLSILFCEAQNLQDAIKQQQQQEAQQRRAAEEQRQREAQQRQAAEERRLRDEQQRQAYDEQRLRENELRYQNAIESAERNVNQRQFAQAKQLYLVALELKPENSASINARIAEVDRMLREEEKAERERRYHEAIRLGDNNFNNRQFAQARQNYLDALSLKPENATSINARIDEVEKRQKEAERDSQYREAIESAQRNFNSGRLSQARMNYQTALNLKPENASSINREIAEIDRQLRFQQEQRERAARKAKNQENAKKVFTWIGVGALVIFAIASGGGG